MVRFVKKYLVLMVVAVLFVGAFLLNLKTNAAKTGSGEDEAFQPAEEAVYGPHVHKVVVVIHHFQQQFVFWLSQLLRQLVVAGADFLLKFCLLQRSV